MSISADDSRGRQGDLPMIAITINGKTYECRDDETVAELVTEHGGDRRGVAVAINEEVIPRGAWAETRLTEGDRVFLVKPVAGGADEAPVADPEPLEIAGRSFSSRLFVGTGRFPSPAVLRQALEASGTEMITVAIRATGLDGSGPDAGILAAIDPDRYQLLPNTAGATTVRQAVFMAELAREALGTNWVKLEVIGDERTLWPDVAATVEATRLLVREGFVVLPYTTTDLVTALRLEEAGAATVMPLGSMIGSGQGIVDLAAIKRIVERVRVPVVVDAGIGTASDATLAMEAGVDACLINTAISRAEHPVAMAVAMRQAVAAGRLSYLAGRMPISDVASPSSPASDLVPAGQ
jgi:thiazole synthase